MRSMLFTRLTARSAVTRAVLVLLMCVGIVSAAWGSSQASGLTSTPKSPPSARSAAPAPPTAPIGR